ncbi:Bypass of stop codon protein 6 [Pseudocercospora fuligena]|uniref:Bypass of stop codon protein 6 n=1 Tax=Pseudocercospora fuligena TaxID=685502 RepID=A0A8H6VFG0_9PEZI|nr:Bypass of stop codon protein 6 [Pseudocercospora fuligena]
MAKATAQPETPIELEANLPEPQHTSPANNASEILAPLELTGLVKLKVFSAAFCFFNAGVSDGSLGALIPYILRHYDISTSWMALPYGISFLGWLTAAVVIGYTRLSFGTGGVLICGALLQLVAQLFRFWTPPFGVLAFSFLPVCLGQGLQDSQANTFVSSIKKAHRWLGLIHGSYATGGLCGPLIASAIASNSGGNWAAFYYVPTGIGAINLALCSYAFWDEATLRKPTDQSEQRRSMVALLELREAVKLKAIVEFLVVVRQGRLSQVGYISSAFFGGTALGRFLLAEPTFRLGEWRMILLYAVVCLAFQIVCWRVPSIVVNAVMVSFLGFLLGPMFATGVSVGSKLIPQELQQSGLALVFVMAQAGGAAFPAITGVIASSAGVASLQPILVGLLTALAASWLLVPNPRKLGLT